MKKRHITTAILLAVAILMIFTFIGCDKDDGGVTPPSPDNTNDGERVVEVFAIQSTVEIGLAESEVYDYTSLFAIVADGVSIPVEKSYIDTSAVPEHQGSGTVTCTYEGASATVTVLISEPVYELNLSKNYITVLETEAAKYNYLQYFRATIDGETEQIVPSMVTSNVKAETGTYKYSVTYHGITKTLTVMVDNGYTVTAYYETREIRDDEILTYKYTSLFVIRDSTGKYVQDSEDYLDVNVTIDGGYVTCTYKGKSATTKIVPIKLKYDIVKLCDSLTIYSGKVASYDFTKLFIGYVDGKERAIASDCVTTDITATPGEYTVTVNFGRATATLPVTVSGDHVIEILPAYSELTVREDEVKTVDLSEYFWLYVDEEIADSADITFDYGTLRDAVCGDTVTVNASYSVDGTTANKSFDVSVTDKATPVVKTADVVTYPNGERINLTSLFTVTLNGAAVEVTADMLSGEVDYSTEGDYPVTLTYDGKDYVSVVHVKRGVSITPVSDPIVVSVGTDKDAYDFASDFEVMVNGIRFRSIERYMDLTAVDFSTEGTYAVKITIPYGEKAGSVQNIEYEATYSVVKYKYEVSVDSDEVVLKTGVYNYDITSNVTVYVNGIKQILTDKSDNIDLDPTAVYYEVLSDEIDYTVSGVKDVKLAIYANGSGKEPIIAEYKLTVCASVYVAGTDKAIFTGATILPEDMFVITENGKTVKPTFDEISGKVNVFEPGVYYVSIDHKGVTAESRIVIIDNAIKGTYHTKLSTIPVEQEYDDEGYATQDAVASKPLKDFIVNDDGSITFGAKNVTIVGAEDERTIKIKIGSYDYTLYYFDGIIVLDPDNSLRMSYSDDKRPMVYFNEGAWNIDSHIIVNRGSKYVLYDTINNYSIDVFGITSTEDAAISKWYALYVNLMSKTSSDTIYSVSWGEAEFSEGFEAKSGERATLTFDGVRYIFDMVSATTAKVDLSADAADYKYANMKFSGKIDGKTARVSFSNKDVATLTIGSDVYQFGSRANAYLDYETDALFLYDFNEKTSKYYSFRIKLDVDNKTFTVDEKDNLFGYYVYDNMYVFLDGYGTGHIAFDKSETNPLAVTYKRVGNELRLAFIGVNSGYAHGTSAKFYVAELLNVLTCKDIADTSLIGAKFVNQYITDGAIISVDVSFVDCGTSYANLRERITVTTKDGTWDETTKKTNFNMNAISTNKGGFYQIVIGNLQVGGESVKAYYVVEYRDKKESELALNYKGGLCDSSTTLEITKYGTANILYNGVKYVGDTFYGEDGTTFIIKAYSATYAFIALKGEVISDGVIKVTASGADKFTEYFTTGKTAIIGAEGCVLREITVGDSVKYYLSNSTNALGAEAQITFEEGTDIKTAGTIFKAQTANRTVYARVTKWGDSVTGLTLADAVRGTYTSTDGDTLTLNGFGTAKLGTETGTYVINVRSVTVKVGGDVNVYMLGADDTYSVADITLDESLISGISYQASYTFYCDNEPYTAVTTFIFGENGVVTVISSSSEHDSGSSSKDMCQTDKYNPPFGSKNGTQGTYAVVGDTVTIKVNGATIVLTIVDVTSPKKLNVISTTVSSDAHGYFGTTVVFETM